MKLKEFLGTNHDRIISIKRVNSGYIGVTQLRLGAVLPSLPESFLDAEVNTYPNKDNPTWPLGYFVDSETGTAYEVVLTDRW